jgi:putative transposase
MPQSLSYVLVHLVFSTKERQPFLQDKSVRIEMHSYLGGTSKQLRCDPLAIGGVADHVHILAALSRTIALAEWVKELKRVSSLWIKTKDSELSTFQWQNGYGAFSVSHSLSDKVIKYIQHQEEHHQKTTFQDEFRQMLRLHNVPYDERYVWD